MSVEVKLVGGPADGKLIAIEGDPMDPPQTVELQQAPRTDWNAPADEPIKPRKLTYRRAPNPGASGPLWHYHYEPQTH